MSQSFDEQELLDRVDQDVEFLAETVQLLVDEGPALVREIRAAAAAGDAAAVGRSAHALKGMISNFCADAAHGSAAEVERLGKGGDLVGVPAAVDALDGRLAELIAALKDFLAARA
jgi:HPt (histidine-containing phosphotransfer) domain-containing protein